MSTAIVTDEAGLRQIVQQAVEEALRHHLPPIVREATEKPWLTKGELKRLTGWSDRTIQHLRDTRQIPFAQHGRKILYPTGDVLAFLKEHRVEPRLE